MKKFLCLLLAAIMLLGCSLTVAEADEFPKLDSIAAWDYVGEWFGVSGMDVMGDPTVEYPDLRLNLFLNGLGDMYLDEGKKEVVGWYVEDGMVFLARTVDKVPDPDEIFAYAYKDETGRLVVDLMTVAVRCEQEGEEYLDVTWPEFDAEDAKYFIGTWKAVSYISEGVEVPAELAGPMTFVLRDDGTAQSIEDEGVYELRWYSDYAVAYLGENPAELAEISFDGNGNISVKLDAENTVIMAPFVETGTILGTWESSDRTVEITQDGKLKLIYKEDGYTNHMQWEIVEGIPTVTLGTWQGSTIEFVDGHLIINYSVLQKLTRVGSVPDIYVGPGGFVVSEDDASVPFVGNWVEESGRGVLTFNQDFTAVMNFTDGSAYDMNWKTTEDGAMFTSGNWFDTPMVIENENTLNISDGWMILYREGTQEQAPAAGAEPSGGEDEMSDEELAALVAAFAAAMEAEEGELPEALKPYVGTWHMVYIATGGMEGDLRERGLTGKLELNADGTGKLSGAADDAGNWYDDEGQVRFGQAETPLTLLDGGFLRYGSQLAGYMVFSQDESAVWSPAPVVTQAPAAPQAPAASGAVSLDALADYTDKKFVAKTYTVSGFTTDAAALGTEYALTIYANNICELSMGGYPTLLKWVQESDRLAVDYMGVMTYYVTLTQAGIDLDMNGMVLNMEAQ